MDTEFSPWKVDNEVVGATKSAGLLSFYIVNNAGHMVPMDSPKAALNMVTGFINKYKWLDWKYVILIIRWEKEANPPSPTSEIQRVNFSKRKISTKPQNPLIMKSPLEIIGKLREIKPLTKATSNWLYSTIPKLS